MSGYAALKGLASVTAAGVTAGAVRSGRGSGV